MRPMKWNCKRLWGSKMKLFVSLMLSLVLYGCSTLKTEQTDLYEEYIKQTQAVKNKTIVSSRMSFFTNEYLKEVDPDNEKSLLLLNLSEYVHQAFSHYQKITDQKGCLSINGIDLNKDPVSLHLEYKKEKGVWLVDYIFLHLIESREDYAEKALCPREVESMIFK